MNENEIRFNQPVEEKPTPSKDENIIRESSDKKKRNFLSLLFKFKKVLRALAIVVILIVIIYLAFLSKDVLGGIFKPKAEVYSAIFISNGQVYFGKIIKNNELEIVLSNVFYIQVNGNTTPEKTTNAISQTSFNLIKLGNELHGPTDELFINRSQVVFYENLRDDSKVVVSIKNYKP